MGAARVHHADAGEADMDVRTAAPMSIRTRCQTIYSSTNYRCRPRITRGHGAARIGSYGCHWTLLRDHQPITTSQRSEQLPNHLLVNEPSLSTQGIGGCCGS